MSRSRMDVAWVIGVGVALWGCGANSEPPRRGLGSDDAPASVGGPGRGPRDGAAPSDTPPALGPASGAARGGPAEPPLPDVSGLTGGGPDFSSFDPGGEGAPAAGGCQQAARTFVPQIPSVFILVDRSGSMFDENPPGSGQNAWASLRRGVLQVIRELESTVRFGFGAFSGQGAICPDMPSTPLALDNEPAIALLYGSLERSAYKDTPTMLALKAVADRLWSDPVVGSKYVLFVTDGEPDYCDDGNPLCPPDSVVGRLQKMALGLDDDGAMNEPIQTLVFGIDSPLSTISPEVLAAFANAGAGQPVAALGAANTSIYAQCNSVPGWAADFAATGKPALGGASVGDYSAVGGDAIVYRPDPNDQAELTAQIRAALAEVKSCAFDLGSDGVQVDVSRPDLGALAQVSIDGVAVPFDTVNGWRMSSGTTVQLEGAACDRWREPGQSSIAFDFPCDVIVIR